MGAEARHVATVLMIGPALDSRGGIASVCDEYRRAGLFERLGIVYLPSYVAGGALAKLLVAGRGLGALAWRLLTRRVRLVHVHMAWGSSVWRKLAFCALARLGGVPYVVHLHSGKFPEFFDQQCGVRRRDLIARALAGAACVVVITEERRRWLAQRGLNRAPVRLLPNMVSLPDAPQLTPTGCDLLFLGRLEEAKGVSMLLLAFAEVRRSHPQARLLLGGEGEAARYRAQADALGLGDAVQMLGWVEGDAKADLLRRARLFVLPSRYEGLPMGVLEAMSCGVPCVVCAVGGVPDIISDGVNGVLVPVDDVQALTRALCALLDDEALRLRLGQAARRTVESRYSPAAVERELTDIYEKAGV